MALSKQDLKARTLAGMEEEERFQKSNEIKGKITKIANAAKQTAASQEARANKEKDLIGAKDASRFTEKYDYSATAAEKRRQNLDESTARRFANPTLSAKAVSSEAEKKPMVPAAQQRRQAVSDQIYENVLKGEAYLQAPTYGPAATPGINNTERVAKGLINRFRSVPGETVENAAYLISDRLNPQNGFENWLVNNANKVVENNVAGQVGDIADAQLMEAKENTGNFGDFIIDAADAATRMGSNAFFFGAPNLALSQGIGGGLEEYRQQREAGTDKGEALFRGVASGAAGYFIERLGGIGGAKKSLVTALVPGTNKLSTSGVTSIITNIAKNAFDEGGEELTESVVNSLSDVIADMVFKGEVTIDFDLIEALRGAAIGALIGGGFGAASYTPTADTALPTVETPAMPTPTPAVGNVTPAAEASKPPVNATLPNVENVTPAIENNQQVPFANATTNTGAINTQNDVIETNKANSTNSDVVNEKENFDLFNTAAEKFGTYEPKAKQTYEGNEEFKSPKMLNNNGTQVVDESVETIAASPLGTKETIDYMKQHIDKFTHAIDTDVDSINKAKVYLEENGLEKSLAHWKNVANGRSKYTKDEGVLAATTIRLLQEQGRINEANEMTAELVAEISTAAQATQGAETLYKILDPAKMKIATNTEYYVKTLTEKLNNTYKDKLKGKTIAVNNALLQKALQANGTDAEGAAWDEVFADIANQVPANFWEKANNIRYFCMLSNPKTHIRNVLSNTVMQGVNIVKDYVKVAVEDFYNNSETVKSGKMQAVKTVTTKAVPQAYKDFAKSDFEVIKDSFDDSGKYSETTGTFVHKYRTKINNNLLLGAVKERFKGDTKTEKLLNKVLDQGVVNSLAELNSYLLNDVEDGKAKSDIYSRALSQYMAANNLTPEYLSSTDGEADLQKARAYATAEALYNTFNESNSISNWLSSGAKGSKAVDIATGAVLPFRKVPMNLVKTAYDYSPANLLASSIKMAKAVKTESDPSTAIDGIAKGVTGTGLVIMGAILRSLGYLTNGLPEDDKEANFEKMLGSQAFSFKVGNKSYSLDWLQPVGMMLFSGAAAYDVWRDLSKGESNIIDKDDALKTAGNFAEIGINSILSFYEPIMEMSMLSNVKDLVAPEYGRSWQEFAGDVIGDYVNQFVPNFITALTKTIDDTERNAYYVDKTNAIPDSVQIAAQNVMAKIPGLSQKLPEKVDVWGNTKKRNPNVAVRAFENFVSPGTYKEYNETKVDEMLKQLYAKTGESSVLPTSFSKNFNVNGERLDLSANQYTTAQKTKGQTAYNMLNQLVADSNFRKLSAEDKADIIKDVYSYATVKGKQKVSDYTTDTKWYKNMEEAQKKENIKPADFLVNRSIYGNLEGTEARSKDMMMYDHLIADKTTSDKEDLAILKYVAGVDFSKYEKATDKPNAILSAYNIIKTEEAKGGEGTQDRIIKQLIADKNTTAKEDLAILENVRSVNFDDYKKAANNNADKTLYLYSLLKSENAKGEQKEKDVDIEAIQKKFKEDVYGAREIYYKAKGDWNEDVSDVLENGTNRDKKVAVFERFKYSDEEITKGYNAVIGLSKKDDMMKALKKAFGNTSKATVFYNILKGKKGYK